MQDCHLLSILLLLLKFAKPLKKKNIQTLILSTKNPNMTVSLYKGLLASPISFSPHFN